MRPNWATVAVPATLGVGGVAALYAWLTMGPAVQTPRRVPGADAGQTSGAVARVARPLQGRLERSDAIPSSIPGAWPCFRGTNRDGISTDPVPLATGWGPGGPRAVWRATMGEGHAGAAVLNGRAYVLDYDSTRQADVLRCMSLDDGRDIWRYSYPVKTKRNHGMSRTVPAVTEKYVVTLGPKCHVSCLDSATGEFRWFMDLVGEFHSAVPPWYAGQCPLVDRDRVILAPGGDALMIAVEGETGRRVWTTPNPRAWAMTHSSILPIEFNGRRMYVYCGRGGVAGVSADDGSLLWDTTEWKISIATIPSPVDMGNGRLFLSGGYEAGCVMLQLEEQAGAIAAKPLWRLPAKEFGAAQHTPILYQGFLYGVRPDGQLCCLAPDGAIRWTSGPAHRFGIGPFLIAQGMIYLLNDSGVLSLARAVPDRYDELAEAKVLTGHDSWGPLALVGGRLLARDLTTMVCLDVSAEGNAATAREPGTKE